MASSPQKGYITSSEINPRHKDDLEELKKQVLAAKPQGPLLKATPSDEVQVQTTVAMLNKAKGKLKYHDYKNWDKHGKVSGTYPREILENQSATFAHTGDDGSEGAVIYKGPNKVGGGDDCAWVVAWKALGRDGDENKVYVETGEIGTYRNTDWDTIRTKLKEKTFSCKDQDTKAEASAEINVKVTKPDVTANFSVAPN